MGTRVGLCCERAGSRNNVSHQSSDRWAQRRDRRSSLGNAKITVDGDISDWPLDKFTQVAEQPLFPEGQNKDSTVAMGDHVVFDAKRVGFFNDTMPGAFTKSVNDFGSSLYFAYDSKFLYILDVCIDNVLRDDKDTTDFGSEGFRNDGVEFLLDMKGDATGCFDSAT